MIPKKKIVIIGGGITGIFSALYLHKNSPKTQIILIESSKNIGGNLRGFNYEETYFDKGTYIFQETGDSEIDNIFESYSSDKDFIKYEKGKGDIIGTIFQNRFQNYTHYPDIREHSSLVDSILKHLRKNSNIKDEWEYSEDLITICKNRFGEKYSKELELIFKNLFKYDPNSLSSFYLKLVGLNRVVISDEKKWNIDFSDENHRKVIGFPNQKKIPKGFLHNRKSFYSKKNGTYSFVEAFEKKLKESGITVHKETRVVQIDSNKKSVEVKNNSNSNVIFFDKLFITTGVLSAVNLLNIKNKILKPKFLKTTFFNVVLNDKTNTDVFYLYNYDSEINFYRLTNYRAYSKNENDKRITIECFDLIEDNIKYLEALLSYFVKLGILKNQNYKSVFIETERNSLPILTPEYFKEFVKLKSVLNYIDSSICIMGAGTGRNFNFYRNEILINCKYQIKNLLNN